MTLYLNFRTSAVGGSIAPDPYVIAGDARVSPLAMTTLGWRLPPDRVAGREIVFATHGFNVSYADGARSLARFAADLALGDKYLFVGVLWPGDFWIPAINYPVEASDAERCGQRLARFANTTLSAARSLSFVSHSLGGRLVLEAVKHLDPPGAREVCLLAAAVDDNCLSTAQYESARHNAQRTSVLASKRDQVLRLAYPAGDFLSDLFGDNDSPWRKALGYHGPRPGPLERVAHEQIPKTADIGHSDYLPPADWNEANGKTAYAAAFVRTALAAD